MAYLWDVYFKGYWYHGTEPYFSLKSFSKGSKSLSPERLKEITLHKQHDSLHGIPAAQVISCYNSAKMSGLSLIKSVERTTSSRDVVLDWITFTSVLENIFTSHTPEYISPDIRTIIIYPLSEIVPGYVDHKSRLTLWFNKDGQQINYAVTFEKYFCKDSLYPKYLRKIKENTFNKTPRQVDQACIHIIDDLLENHYDYITDIANSPKPKGNLR